MQGGPDSALISPFERKLMMLEVSAAPQPPEPLDAHPYQRCTRKGA